MGDMQITYADMERAAQDLASGQADIEATLMRLQNGIRGLVAQGYVTGSSSHRFEAAYEEFNSGVREVVRGLDGMGHFLRQAAQTFRETDERLGASL